MKKSVPSEDKAKKIVQRVIDMSKTDHELCFDVVRDLGLDVDGEDLVVEYEEEAKDEANE